MWSVKGVSRKRRENVIKGRVIGVLARLSGIQMILYIVYAGIKYSGHQCACTNQLPL